MRKCLCLFLVLIMIGLLPGCGRNTQQASAAKVGSGDGTQLNDPANQSGSVVTATGEPSMNPADMLMPDEASALALEHAGLSETDVVGLHAAMEIENGIPQYDVEFRSGHVEYEYHIHAETGEVLSWDRSD